MWLFLAIFASILQVLRNSFQRSLVFDAGIWGATWVRFAFGFPISLLAFVIILFFSNHNNLHFEFKFLIIGAIGALAQVLATAALLKSMQKGSFALGATLQHSSLLMTALFGLVFLGDRLGIIQWIGFLSATIGMILSSWSKGKIFDIENKDNLLSGFYGLLCGFCFAISANCFRSSVLILQENPTILVSCLTVFYVQFVQAFFLGLYLYIFERTKLKLALASWHQSLGAGFAGSASSIVWFLVLALVPAAIARTINLVIEAPLSAFIGYFKFKEKIEIRKIIAIILIIFGVILAIYNF